MFSFRVSIHQYKTSEYTSLQFLFYFKYYCPFCALYHCLQLLGFDIGLLYWCAIVFALRGFDLPFTFTLYVYPLLLFAVSGIVCGLTWCDMVIMASHCCWMDPHNVNRECPSCLGMAHLREDVDNPWSAACDLSKEEWLCCSIRVCGSVPELGRGRERPLHITH